MLGVGSNREPIKGKYAEQLREHIMDIQTSKQALIEQATEFMYHWMLELGTEDEDAIDAAQQMHQHLTGELMENIEEFLGVDEDEDREED